MKDNKEINVLVLYQYPHEKEEPAIIKESLELMNKAWKIDNKEVKATRLSGWDKNVGEDNILNVYKKACDYFDYAVGFLTHDDRDASEAGNLWFELSFWFAVNGGDRIIVMRQDHQDVNLISNISSYPAPSVESAEEVCNKFKELVQNYNVKQSQGQSANDLDDILKIKEVLHGTNKWKRDDFEYCHDVKLSGSHRCNRVRPTLRMIAELVRFGEAEEEAVKLAISLQDINDKAKTISNNIKEMEDESQEISVKRSKLVLLCTQFDALYQVVEENIVNKIEKWPRMQKNREVPWAWDKRLKEFVKRRGLRLDSEITTLTDSLEFFYKANYKKSQWYKKEYQRS